MVEVLCFETAPSIRKIAASNHQFLQTAAKPLSLREKVILLLDEDQETLSFAHTRKNDTL